MSKHLLQTYAKCNPEFSYQPTRNPRRVLTKPSKPALNDGHDNEEGDYILYVNDVLGAQEGQQLSFLLIIFCLCVFVCMIIFFGIGGDG